MPQPCAANRELELGTKNFPETLLNFLFNKSPKSNGTDLVISQRFAAIIFQSRYFLATQFWLEAELRSAGR